MSTLEDLVLKPSESIKDDYEDLKVNQRIIEKVVVSNKPY